MDRIIFFIFIIFVASPLWGQQATLQKIAEDYEKKAMSAHAAQDREMAYAYIDSIKHLGGEYEWIAKLVRADIYLFIEDSMEVSRQLLKDCIAHYTLKKDTSNLLTAYQDLFFANRNVYKIEESIELLNKAIDLANQSNDTANIAYFEGRFGLFYLDVLEDTTNSIPHLEKALSYSVKSQNWVNASQNAYYLSDAYLLQGDSLGAKKMIDLSLTYSLKVDPSDPLYYDGYLHQGYHYLTKKNYSKAIEYALICFQKAQELKDYDLLLLSCNVLIPAYWKSGQVDKGFYYAQKALPIMEGEGSLYWLRDIYLYSSKIYKTKHRYKEALSYLETYYKHEITSNEKSKTRAVTQILYNGEIERKNAEKAQVELNLKLVRAQANFQWLVILAILFLLAITITYSFFIYKKRKETSQLNKVLAASQEVVLQQKEILLKDYQELQKTLEEKEEEKSSVYFTQSAIQLKFEDIIYLESDNNYVLIHTKNRATPLLERIKMIELVKQLPSTLFVKIHRSYYINRTHIVARPSKYMLEMSNGDMLKPSRGFVDNLGNQFL